MKKCPKESDLPDLPKMPSTTFRMAAVADLMSSPFQVRFDLDDPELAELTESVKTYGVLEPILVRSKPSGNLEVVAGERRLHAAKKASVPAVPVLIKTLSDEEAFILQLTENLQRRDLTEEEKTHSLAELARRTKWTAQEIADKLKMSYRWVAKYLPSEFKDKDMAELGKLGAESKAYSEKEQDLHVAARHAAESALTQTPTAPIPGECDALEQPPILPSTSKSPEIKPRASAIDTGLGITCSECQQTFTLIHVGNNLHRLQKINIMNSEDLKNER